MEGKQPMISLKPNYGNWVSTRLLYGPGALALLTLGFSCLFPPLSALAVLIALVFLYFLYARIQFSAGGGNIQSQVQGLLLSRLDWDGKGRVLDIGCGNGPLTILIALKFPLSHITGIDSWGGSWEYSKQACEKNAGIEGVAERVDFQKGSASALPFEDESFDVAVSNLVFHEVSGAKDKREVVREALRVVKKGGKFAFQDLFLIKQAYGEIDDLLATIKSWGISNVEFIKTCDADFIPALLKLPFMVGTIGIITGEK